VRAVTQGMLSLLLMAGSALAQQYVISTVAGGTPIATPIAATSASIGGPEGVAVGPAGEVYFTGYGHSVYRIDARGVLTRLAGNGRAGFSGDGGPAASAQLSRPSGVAVDAAGALYIADYYNNCIRKVATNGIITTVTGSGSVGYSGDGGPATSAQLYYPRGVAVDSSGNLYIADYSNQRIRRVGRNGIITTIAGNGSSGYSGDAGPATSAQLAGPSGVAVDDAGNVYIADGNNNRIRKVGTNGMITTVAGNGSEGYSGDRGLAANAQLYYPRDVAVDAEGNLYIADSGNSRIRKVETNRVITTVAGSAPGFYYGDGGQAASAQLNGPSGVAVDAAGNLYMADCHNNRIRKVATDGIITTIAGNGSPGYSGDGGPAASAQLNGPSGVAVDAAGNLYIADFYGNRVRKVAMNGIITTVAGDGSNGYSGDGGPAAGAQVYYPSGVAVDAAGNLYIADFGYNRIRKVATNGIITTVAGGGPQGDSGDGGPATSAQLSNPAGVAVDAAGNLYIAVSGSHRIRKVAANGAITTVAGNGSYGYSGDGGRATGAQLGAPWGVAVDAAGNLYIADSNNGVIRKVAANGIITTVAGNGSNGYSGDGGPAASAQLYSPSGVAVDAAGNLYIADYRNSRIRKVATNGIITTVAGNYYGYSGDGGPAASAQLSLPWGVTVDATGNVYVADSSNNAIRLLKPIAPPLTTRASANAASNLIGPMAPGEIVVLFGSGIGPAQLTQTRAGDSGRYGTSLAGTRVLFNGIPAPMIYTWATQASAVVPYNLGGNVAGVQVEYQGVKSDPIAVSIAPSAPGLFTLDSTGQGQAAAFNEDGSLNTASSPAKVGTIVSLYATGEGRTSPAGVDGKPAATPLPKPLLPVQVTIDGKPAEVTYAGGAPGLVAGLMQINARIPAGAQVGTAPVVITVGSASSQPGVIIEVAGN
jgi:uncharacterized protein (TIGR03437 family)